MPLATTTSPTFTIDSVATNQAGPYEVVVSNAVGTAVSMAARLTVKPAPINPRVEFTFVPSLGSFEDLRGRVLNVSPADYRIAVYIQAWVGWWTKPYWASPLTPIASDGTWTCDITTGGSDATASAIAAFLVPASYDPPSLGGAGSLPPELTLHSEARAYAIRNPGVIIAPNIIGQPANQRVLFGRTARRQSRRVAPLR